MQKVLALQKLPIAAEFDEDGPLFASNTSVQCSGWHNSTLSHSCTVELD